MGKASQLPLIVFCGLLLTASAFSCDITLPAFWSMQQELGASIEWLQAMVPVFLLAPLLGFALVALAAGGRSLAAWRCLPECCWRRPLSGFQKPTPLQTAMRCARSWRCLAFRCWLDPCCRGGDHARRDRGGSAPQQARSACLPRLVIAGHLAAAKRRGSTPARESVRFRGQRIDCLQRAKRQTGPWHEGRPCK